MKFKFLAKKIINISNYFLYKFSFNFFISKKIIKKKTDVKKNLIVLNSQDSLGDQIVFTDFISRINNASTNREKWTILYPLSFKDLLENMHFKNINFIFIKNSVGSHISYRESLFIKNFLKIIKLKKEIKKKKMEFNNVFFVSRLMEINNLTIASNITCNHIYKWLDNPNGNSDKNSVEQISNLFFPLNSMNKMYYKHLKNKMEIYSNVFENIHYSKNLWNFFCSYEKLTKKDKSFNYCYEIIWKSLKKQKKENKNILKVVICVNREIYKVLLLDCYIYILNELSKKNNIFVQFIGNFSNKKKYYIKEKYIKENCNFPYENKIQKTNLKELIKIVHCSDIVFTEDTWLCHMSNLLMKDTIVFVNKEHWRYKHTINFWDNYKFSKSEKHIYKIFHLKNCFFYPKNNKLKENFLYISKYVIPFIENVINKKYKKQLIC